MASRSYEVAFRINGALSGQFASAMQAAQNAMRNLGQAARQVNSAMAGSMGTLNGYLSRLQAVANQSAKYAQLQSQIPKTQSNLQEQIAKTAELSRAYQQQKNQVESMKAAMQRLQSQAAAMKANWQAEKSALQGLKDQLKTLGQAYKEVSASQGKSSADAQRLRSQIESLKSAITSQKGAVDSAKSSYDTLKASLKGAASELKSAESSLKTLGTSFASSKSKVQELYHTLQQQKAALESLKSSLGSAGFSTDHFIQSEMRLRSEIESTTRAIERQAQLSARLTSAQDRVNTASTNLNEAQSAFNTVTSTVGALASPLIDATDTAKDFERQMSEVKALTQMDNIRVGNFAEVERQMTMLENQAKELGRTTIYRASDVGSAQAYIARTGWNADQIHDTLPAFLQAAAANHMDVSRVADIGTNIMAAFGHGPEQATRDMEILNYTVTHSNQTFEQLGEAMKYAAPIAKNFGADMLELAAMTKPLADAGIQGSMAGTSLRQTMLRLTAPPKKASKAMDEYGITLDDATKAWNNANEVASQYGVTMDQSLTPGKQMLSIMRQIDKNMAGLSPQEKMAAFSAITGINAVSGAINLFDAGADYIADFESRLENSQGTLQQTYDTMVNNTYGAVEGLKSAWEGVQLSIGEALLPVEKAGAEFLAPLLVGFAEFATANPAIVQGIVAIGAALAGIATLATGVAVAFAGWSFITAQISMFTAGMAAVRGGMLATEVASLGMTARMGAAFTTMSATATSAFASLRAITWSGLFTGLTAQIAAARVAITGFFASIASGAAFSNLAASISSIGTAFMAAARGAMAFAFSPVGAALMALALLAYVVYENWDRLGPVFTNLASTITSAFSNVAATVGPALSALGESVGKIFESLNAIGAGDTIIRVFLLILNVVTTVAATIVEVFGQAVKTVADLFTNLADVVSHALNGEFLEAAKSAGNIFVDGFNDTIDTIKASGKLLEIPENYQKSMEIYNQAQTVPSQAATQRHNRYAESTTAASTPTETPELDISAVQTAMNNAGQVPQVDVPANLPNSEIPQLDTTNAQAQIDALGQATQQPAQNLPQVGQGVEQANQALQNFPATLQPVQDALSNLPAALAPMQSAFGFFTGQINFAAGQFGFFTGQINFAAGQFGYFTGQINFASGQLGFFTGQINFASGQLAFLSGQMAVAAGQVTFFGTAAGGAADNVSFFGSVAGTAAGQVSGMGSAAQSVASALQSAAAQISSIKITVPTITVGGAAPAANYKGGIYNKGAFLTWFAEKSPEAAIPLDRSERAINLWTQAGQMLGVLPSDNTAELPTEKPSTDATKRGIINFQRLKEQRANQIYETIINQQNQQNYSTFSAADTSLNNMASTISSISTVQNSVQNLQAAQFDELGNIIGLNGAAGNVITKYDNDKIKHVKQTAQIKEYNQRQNRIAEMAQSVPAENASLFSRVLDKIKGLFAGVKNVFAGEEIPRTLPDGMANQNYEEPARELRILTEQQRYRSENAADEKTLDRIRNSKSYQAIVNLQNASNRTSRSVLNRGELNTFNFSRNFFFSFDSNFLSLYTNYAFKHCSFKFVFHFY